MERIEKTEIHAELCDEKQNGISNVDAVITAENAVSNERSGKARIRVLYADKDQGIIWFELPGVGRLFGYLVENSNFTNDSLTQYVDANLIIAGQYDFICRERLSVDVLEFPPVDRFSSYEVPCGRKGVPFTQKYCENTEVITCVHGKIRGENNGSEFIENEVALVEVYPCVLYAMDEDVEVCMGYLCVDIVGIDEIPQTESDSLKKAANEYVKLDIYYQKSEDYEVDAEYRRAPPVITFDSTAGTCLRVGCYEWTYPNANGYEKIYEEEIQKIEDSIKVNSPYYYAKNVGVNIRIEDVFVIYDITLDWFWDSLFVRNWTDCENYQTFQWDPLRMGVLKMENGQCYLEGMFKTCALYLDEKQDLQELESMVDKFVYVGGNLCIEYKNADSC